tara:strand:+ start:68 stop:829 length:762 start_codon:yes stop_codon:yes gene_type:complete
MNEIRNAIELIENAPSKVASTFISSLLASRAIERINARKFELDEEAAQQAPVEQPDEVDAAMKEIELAMAQKNLEMMDTQDDLVRQQAAMSDPTGAKELFLKSYMYKDQIVTLKKVGSGVSSPVVVYVDRGNGPEKLDTFLTTGQAERESKKILKLQAKQMKKIEKEQKKQEASVQEASIEALESAELDGVLMLHEDEGIGFLTFEEASDALEIYKRLNNTNKRAFEKKLKSSEDEATDMIHHFQERLKRDII